MIFDCWLCGSAVSLDDEYKAHATCGCGALYKREIGGKEIWREENFSPCGDGTYFASVEETRLTKDVPIR